MIKRKIVQMEMMKMIISAVSSSSHVKELPILINLAHLDIWALT